MKTQEILKKVKDVLLKDRVAAWYDFNLMGTKQSNTVEILLKGIEEKKISIMEALYISFIVGFQWHEDFEKAEKEG